MNVDRMNKLADYIESMPHFTDHPGDNVDVFNLSTWLSDRYHNCGTAGCIGGWAKIMAAKDLGVSHDSSEANSRYWLNLTRQEAEDLFFPQTAEWGGLDWDDVKPKEAAEVIRLAAKGMRVRNAFNLVMNDLPRPKSEDEELKELGDGINQLRVNQLQGVKS